MCLFPSVTVATRNHTHLHQLVCLLCKHTRLSHHHLLSELTNGLFAHASVFSKGGFDNIACPSCASDTAHCFSPFSQTQLTVEFWSAPPPFTDELRRLWEAQCPMNWSQRMSWPEEEQGQGTCEHHDCAWVNYLEREPSSQSQVNWLPVNRS